jgi:hypothetical protein
LLAEHVSGLASTTTSSTPESNRSVPTDEGPDPVLADVAEFFNLDFSYFSDGRTDRFFLPEIMGGGAAWLDYDGDGWLDLFIANGCVLPDDGQDSINTGRLFRSNRGTAFLDATTMARADDRGYGQGVAVADVNNDGFPDFYVTHYASNRLWVNNGDGSFTDTTSWASVASASWSTSCSFGDLDRDGDVDLYVAHYARTTIETTPVCTYSDRTGQKVRGYCGPDRYEGESGELFCNMGDGTFQEMTKETGCYDPVGKGLAVVMANLTDDDWPDIYVANDMAKNFLFCNLSGNKSPGSASILMEDRGVSSGTALTGSGRPGASMGIGCADYDHNGWLDLVVSNYLNHGTNLYRNQNGQFLDTSSGSNVLVASLPYLGFGCGFFDFDNDGWSDIFVTNGHVLGPLVGPPDRMRGQVLRNLRDGRFAEVTDTAGPYFYQEFFGRGVAFADFTNSGATGMLVVHQNEPAALLRNDTPDRGHYFGLHLVGRQSNRESLNVRIIAHVGGEQRIAESIGGGSYLSDSDHRVLLGLGPAKRVDRLEVRWPSGKVDEWTDLDADRYWLLLEGDTPRVSPINLGNDARKR